VLKISAGKPHFTYDSWRVDKRVGENLGAYLAGSLAESEKYILGYPDPEDGTIIYGFVVSELGL
jgi:hypothetical protein